MPKNFYVWMRDLHLYAGLFVSPFVVVFAISAIMFNHAWNPGEGEPDANTRRETITVETPEDPAGLDLAKHIMNQAGITGEIRYVQRRKNRLIIPVMRPGEEILIRVDMDNQTAEIERQSASTWDALLYLHKSPGPHNASIRGNWIYTRLWGWLTDVVVCLILFLSASGIYLWTALKATRRTGFVLIGAGALSFAAILLILV